MQDCSLVFKGTFSAQCTLICVMWIPKLKGGTRVPSTWMEAAVCWCTGFLPLAQGTNRMLLLFLERACVHEMCFCSSKHYPGCQLSTRTISLQGRDHKTYPKIQGSPLLSSTFLGTRCKNYAHTYVFYCWSPACILSLTSKLLKAYPWYLDFATGWQKYLLSHAFLSPYNFQALKGTLLSCTAI